MSNFVHTHLHTEFSQLDGLTRLPTLVKRLQEVDQGACAITDHGEVSGHYKFYNEMIKNDIFPILGIESYFTEDRKEKVGKKGEFNDHMTLLAKNNEGLRNLWILSSYAWLEGMHYNPRMDWELLEKYSNGIIASSGCLSGIVARLLRDEEPRADHEKAVERIGRLLNIFGDNFYLELHTFDAEEQKTVNKRLVDLGSQFGVPLVAVSDSHYTFYGDWEDHEAITAMSMGKSYNDPDRFQYGPDQLRVFSEDEVRQRLEYLGSDVADEAVRNAGLFASQCEVKLESEDSTPMFYNDIDLDARELKKLAYEGFVKKIQGQVDDEAKYSERLLYEIEVIENKQFSGYFLLVADIVRWAKQNGLIVGPGRGSAGGSLLSYCMDITEIDPIKFNLIFERFLNPDRDAMPDIDLDLPKDERYLVREYLEEKYGKDCVATIGTFSRWAPKSVMRDAARYFKMPINEADSLAKVIDDVWRVDFEVDDINEGWNQLFEEHRSEFKYWEDKYPQVIQFMNRHVGHIRHAGGHAAGVVLAKESLIGRLPLRLAKNDIRTQMEDEDVESMGFLKVDLLGLRTLSTIIRAYNMVRERYGDIIHHPNDWQYHWDRYYEDASVFESIANARNTGIFQLETAPMQGATKRVRPGNIDDIATILAIVRPGITRSTDPESGLNLLELYLRKREGKMPVVYKDDRLKPILKNSYGSFVFQEQIMQLANQLAGYSLSETDARVRKPIGKKKKAQVEAEKPNFIQGLIDNSGFDESTAESVFSEIEAHGQYSFNRCISGDTLVYPGGEYNYPVSLEQFYRNFNQSEFLHEPRFGKPAIYEGPCVICGEYSDKSYAGRSPYSRGRCTTCATLAQKYKRQGVTLTSYDETSGRIELENVRDVYYQGVQSLYRISLDDGSYLDCTSNHRSLTKRGWLRTDEMEEGEDSLIVDAGYDDFIDSAKYRKTTGERQYKGYVNGAFGKDNYGYVDGGFSSFQEWADNAPNYCEFCGDDKKRLERAHIDGDTTNNNPTNLRVFCVSCHKSFDYRNNNRRKRWEKGRLVEYKRIVSVEYIGEQDTYDIEMKGPNHNFLANNIVTHNSHSYGYALISYWCAYFKYYFAPEFMTALFQTNPKMTSVYLRECRRLGINVLPPDVNESGEEFTLTQNNDIRFGLRDIKWVGGSAKIIMESGPYQSIEELYYSVPRKIINKRVFEALACVGALNSIVTNAGDFPPEWPIEKIALHQYWTLRSKDVDDDEFEEYCEGLNIDDRTSCEMHYLDALVSHDPMKPYVHLIDHEDNFVGEDNMFTNERTRLAGVVTRRKDLKTKKGKNPGRAMCQLWVEPANLVEHNESGDSEDESKQVDEIQLVAFPDVFSQYDQYIQPGAPVLCDVQKLEKGGLSVKTLFRLDKLEEEIQQLEGDIQHA